MIKHCLLKVTTGSELVVVEVVLNVHHEAPFYAASTGLVTQALLMLVELPVDTLIVLSAQQLVSEGQDESSASVQAAGSVLAVATHE